MQERYLLTTFPFLQKDVDRLESEKLLAEFIGIERIMLHDLHSLTEASIGFVNQGKLEQALALTTFILKSIAGQPGGHLLPVKLTALASRGSAFAMCANSHGEAGKERLRGKFLVFLGDCCQDRSSGCVFLQLEIWWSFYVVILSLPRCVGGDCKGVSVERQWGGQAHEISPDTLRYVNDCMGGCCGGRCLPEAGLSSSLQVPLDRL